MELASAPLEGRLLRRYKRFLADVELPGGEVVVAHCPNTGSLIGCKEPGSRVWLRDSGNPARKLRYTWQAIHVEGTWINVDTSLPNHVVHEAVAAGEIPELAGYERIRREVPYGRGSRIDLLLEAEGRPDCYVEVKSTTYAEGPVGLFPDAATERGRKHLDELARVARSGGRAVQLFLVVRDDVTSFRPADHIDPDYGRALRRARRAGVEALAWRARVSERSIEVDRRLPVDTSAPVPRRRRRKA